jgi:hypothetical protein
MTYTTMEKPFEDGGIDAQKTMHIMYSQLKLCNMR